MQEDLRVQISPDQALSEQTFSRDAQGNIVIKNDAMKASLTRNLQNLENTKGAVPAVRIGVVIEW